MTDNCNCIFCRMSQLTELAGEIEAETPIANADLYLLMQTVTFLAILKGVPANDFEKILNQAWAQSEALVASGINKRKMN